jgi:hypothetical protein
VDYPGLPDDIFANKNFQFGYVLEGLGMENVGTHILQLFGTFNRQLLYFMTVRYILWSFGIFYLVLVNLTKKICQPWRYHRGLFFYPLHKYIIFSFPRKNSNFVVIFSGKTKIRYVTLTFFKTVQKVEG